ncbi:hypothetical protein JYU34_000829 [Plutella xylostella]|uniref:Uncharacterized protein n=1 Tax=Plutella xylostella TaxID=51655 RepID=A0ABQ7R8M3_PLUXY|nr:hypothetical protein JYU34_000829 [Plutella xylostella]
MGSTERALGARLAGHGGARQASPAAESSVPETGAPHAVQPAPPRACVHYPMQQITTIRLVTLAKVAKVPKVTKMPMVP